MRVVLLSILLLVELLCVFKPAREIDNELGPYVSNYLDLVKEECPRVSLPRQVIIKFSKLPSGVMAWCVPRPAGFKIEINEETWGFETVEGRYSLVVHELSHCVLGLPHSQDEYNYMYYNDKNDLHPEIVDIQLRKDAKDFCKKRGFRESIRF